MFNRILSRTYSKLLRYRHHLSNFEFSEANACIPRGLRLKKTPCIQSSNSDFYDNWSRTLRQTENHLVYLLKSEVTAIQKDLEGQVNAMLNEVISTEGEEAAERLLDGIRKEHEELEESLMNRRLKKWQTLMPDEAHVNRPRISSEAMNRVQDVLSDAQNFNQQHHLHSPSPNNFIDNHHHDEDEDREDLNQTEVRTDNLNYLDNVLNLSNRTLTSAELSVLSRGLNFCPTPKIIDRFQLKKDLVEFGRSLKCKLFFHGKSNTSNAEVFSKFRKKSTWNPPVIEPALDLFISELEVRLLSLADKGGRNYSNLSSAERIALKNLKTYKDIVIKR